MRPIKFRVWREGEGWVPNVYSEDLFRSSPKEEFVIEYSTKGWNGNIHIMQYTGLKDKNGKEIYEGDILKHNEGPLPIAVEFMEGYFYPLVEIEAMPETWITTNDIEVIGNIHENPDLLPEK